ncbi:MAG: hypothetical protein COB99_03905 [Sulfurimonas sp.]|nr:MAG: hypothetical protein COB99_03905 [Sulfurimonas sp.]
MSLPMMTQVTSSGIESNLVQEAIFAAATEVNEATSHMWDEYSMNDVNLTEFSRVTDINNECNATTFKRPGHINRRCINNLALTSYSAGTGTIFNFSVNFAEHNASSIFIAPTGSSTLSAEGYKQNYNSTAVVSNSASFGQVTDNPNNNMKEIQVTITNATTNDVVTVLTAYTANIGEPDLGSGNIYHKGTY